MNRDSPIDQSFISLWFGTRIKGTYYQYLNLGKSICDSIKKLESWVNNLYSNNLYCLLDATKSTPNDILYCYYQFCNYKMYPIFYFKWTFNRDTICLLYCDVLTRILKVLTIENQIKWISVRHGRHPFFKQDRFRSWLD